MFLCETIELPQKIEEPGGLIAMQGTVEDLAKYGARRPPQ
jgi:hypothetical protein